VPSFPSRCHAVNRFEARLYVGGSSLLTVRRCSLRAVRGRKCETYNARDRSRYTGEFPQMHPNTLRRSSKMLCIETGIAIGHLRQKCYAPAHVTSGKMRKHLIAFGAA
jgi:hypothetical protein